MLVVANGWTRSICFSGLHVKVRERTMTSRTRYAEFSGDAADLRLMLEKAKTSATRKDEHGLARMVFEGVDLTPDDAAQMKRIKARVAIEETIRVMMEKGADDEAIEKATMAIDAKTKVGVEKTQGLA